MDIPGGNAVNMDAYRITPARRPLNLYLADNVYWNRPLNQRVSRPMQLPSTFRCPSDSFMLASSFSSSARADGERMWEWWGSSYPINWHWANYDVFMGSNYLNQLLGGGVRFLSDSGGRHSSELVLFLEGPFNYASGGARPEGYEGPPWGSQFPRLNMIGSHGVLDYHSAAFRDGAARYARFDTRFVYGDGWTLWPRRPWEAPWDAYDGMD